MGRGLGAYGLQAAIAECHAVAASVDDTDWERIVVLYEALGRLAPSPVVELNRAVAVSMARGPAAALAVVDDLVAGERLAGSHLLPSVRGELLTRLQRPDEARAGAGRAIRSVCQRPRARRARAQAPAARVNGLLRSRRRRPGGARSRRGDPSTAGAR